jgi:hypothetical protein
VWLVSGEINYLSMDLKLIGVLEIKEIGGLVGHVYLSPRRLLRCHHLMMTIHVGRGYQHGFQYK